MDICFHFPFTDYSRQPCTLVCWQDLPLMALCVWGGCKFFFLSPRVWRLRQLAIAIDHSLLVPLLHIPNHDHAARRVQSWLFASLVHSLTLILHKYKELDLSGEMGSWKLFLICSSPLFALILSAILLAILLRHYPISEVKKIALQCTTYRCHI